MEVIICWITKKSGKILKDMRDYIRFQTQEEFGAFKDKSI